MALTQTKVDRIRTLGRHGDGGGLYLQVQGEPDVPGQSPKPRSKSWLFRYERALRDEAGEIIRKPNGRPKAREHWLGLGSADTFNLEEARERARDIRKLLASGVDPMAQKASEKAERARKAAKRRTFRQAAQEYFNEHQAGWKNDKHRKQFLSSLETYAFGLIGDMGVDAITVDDVLAVMIQKVGEGDKAGRFWDVRHETADRVRQRIAMVLQRATGFGHREGDNPAAMTGRLKAALGKAAKNAAKQKRNQPALPWPQMAEFMAALRTREGIAARALELTILTAGRSGEVLKAQWSEFDLQAKIWTVPADRMKAGKLHRVPLSARAIEILEQLPRDTKSDWVFPSPGKAGSHLSDMAMAAVVKRMNAEDDAPRWVDPKQNNEPIVPHGFRSSFKDWATEATHYAHEVIEAAMAHSISHKVEAAYRRGDMLDKRKPLMTDWAAYCAGELPAQGDNVIAIGAAR